MASSAAKAPPVEATSTLPPLPSEKAIKGPPLGSFAHTIRLVVLLSLNSILVFLCLFVLPSHLLWRQAVKQHHLTDVAKSQLAFDAVSDSTSRAQSATRNLIVAFQIIFSAPSSDTTATAWIRRGLRSAFAAVLLAQGWFIARFKGWWDEAEAMERGDRDEVLKRRRVTMGKQMENVTMTTFSLPLLAIAMYIVCVLCGSPILKNSLDTLFLGAYIALLAILPAVHVLGTDESEWVKAMTWASSGRTRSPRLRLLVQIVTCTLTGALLASAGFLLDWDKAWQIYPVPPILGACLGLMCGNLIAGFTYFFTASSRLSRSVERRAGSSSKAKAKKKKR